MTSMKDGGKRIRLATSSAAPFEDRLRTVHSTPLPSNAMVAPFRTLWRGTDLFSMTAVILLIRIWLHVCRNTRTELQTGERQRRYRGLRIHPRFTIMREAMKLTASQRRSTP